MSFVQPRQRTLRNGKVHEGFGEKEASEPDNTSLTTISTASATEEFVCPACEGFMNAGHMGLPLQAAHREHTELPGLSGLAAYVEENKSQDYYDALERSRVIRLERLRAEYRPTMPTEFLNDWARDVNEASVPTNNPTTPVAPPDSERADQQRAYETLEGARMSRLDRLRAEYRAMISTEFLHAWALDMIENMAPTEWPPAESNDRRLGR